MPRCVTLDLEGIMVDEPAWADDGDDAPDFEIYPEELEDDIDGTYDEPDAEL